MKVDYFIINVEEIFMSPAIEYPLIFRCVALLYFITLCGLPSTTVSLSSKAKSDIHVTHIQKADLNKYAFFDIESLNTDCNFIE
jgi:hypothetical protein